MMAETEAQRRANVSYKKKNVKQITVSFFPADAELYEWMTANGYRGAWLKELARREYEEELSRRTGWYENGDGSPEKG